MLICPNADHTDGLLDITMAHSDPRTKLVRLFPTVYQGHARRTRRGEHRTRQDGLRRVPGHQRVRRRRLRLPAPRRDLRGARARCRSFGQTADHDGVTLRTPKTTSWHDPSSGGSRRCRDAARPDCRHGGSGSGLRAMACSGSLRRYGFGLGRALHGDLLGQPEDRHQRGGPHARSRPVGQILVHLELLDRRLRRQGQRRAGLDESVRAAVGPLHLERVAVDRASDLEIRLPLSRRPGGTRPGTVGHCPEAGR